MFTGAALWITSLWNKGFALNTRPDLLIEAILITAVGYYLILPVLKIVLLPINFLTFGLVSFLVYLMFFYLLDQQVNVLTISSWVFGGFQTPIVIVPQLHIGYTQNLALSALSMSFIINSLETLL